MLCVAGKKQKRTVACIRVVASLNSKRKEKKRKENQKHKNDDDGIEITFDQNRDHE